jgi:hypothetical protein
MLSPDKNLLAHGASELTTGDKNYEQKYTMHQFKRVCTNNHLT